MLCAKSELLRPQTPQPNAVGLPDTLINVAAAAAIAEFDTAPSNNNNSREEKLISVDLSRCE